MKSLHFSHTATAAQCHIIGLIKLTSLIVAMPYYNKLIRTLGDTFNIKLINKLTSKLTMPLVPYVNT